jgi:transcriptional regulator with XRE-family HTH domain
MQMACAIVFPQTRGMDDYKGRALAYLREVVAVTGKSASELADLIGVAPSTFTRPLNSATFKYAPKYQNLAAVAEKTGIALPAELLQARPLPAIPQTQTLPIRYKVAAGAWEAVDEMRDEPLGFDEAHKIDAYADVPQWLERVVGDSYNLKIPDGYLVHVVDAIEIQYRPRHGDTVVVLRSRAQGSFLERSLKEVVITPFGVELWPRSHNPIHDQPLKYRPGTDEADDVVVQIVGLVVRSYQSFSG